MGRSPVSVGGAPGLLAGAGELGCFSEETTDGVGKTPISKTMISLLAPLLLLQGAVPATPLESEAPPSEPIVQSPSVLYIHGGQILLGDGGRVEALLVENGRVVAAGREDTLADRLPEEGLVRLNLDGATAVPGLQDAHGHVELYGSTLEQVDLRGLESYEEVIAAVAERAATTEAGQWIEGFGWDQNLWADGKLPTHELLSEAVPTHPVFLTRIGGHTALVNEKALEEAHLGGVLDPPPRLQGGRFPLDEEGRATGLLVDNAMDLVRDYLPEVDRESRERRILAAQEKLLAYGLTCVHDMGVNPEGIALYEDLKERGLLKIRVVVYLEGNDGFSAELLESLPRGDDHLAITGVKFFADGALGSRGAALLDDYADAPGERGHLLLSEETLTALVHQAWQAGLQPAVHAIGDEANRLALDVYERMIQVDGSFSQLRPRIEHAQVVSARDIPRFPQLDVIPSMQPVHVASDQAWIEERLGQRRSLTAYAWRSLAPGVMELAFGSDFPIESPDPLRGIHAARTRRKGHDLATEGFLEGSPLDGYTALVGFTSGPAHAVHQEDRRGRLSPGYWADLTVFDIDPTECDPARLLEARVLLTVIDGQVVYQP